MVCRRFTMASLGSEASAINGAPTAAPRAFEAAAATSAHLVPSCYNDCNGRGTCESPGLCSCRAPWSGWDCIEDGLAQLAASAAPSTHEEHGFVYVYSPPHELGHAAMRHDAMRLEPMDPLYTAEQHFFERLMADRTLRTLDPHRARLFYVPTFLLPTHPNTVYATGVSHYHKLVQALSARDATFAKAWRENRSRHIFFLSGDKGACLWPRGPIYISHWGLTTPWKAMMLPQLWRKDVLVSARANEPPCADARDIILPPVIAHPFNHSAATARFPQSRPAWRCELFFAGAMTAEQKNKHASWCDNGRHGGVRCYSQGVRAAVLAHHHNRSGFCLARQLPPELYADSRFCLAPSGEGFGDRLANAMLSGCVPLIIQPAVRQPYDDVLPYERFSIRIGADRIPALHEVLRAVTDEQHARLRAGVRHFARAFEWLRTGAQAYEAARYSLCLRAERPGGCAALRPLWLHHHPRPRRAKEPSQSLGGVTDHVADMGRVDESLSPRLDATVRYVVRPRRGTRRARAPA